MCKKLLFLTSLILLLSSISIAEDIQWTGAGRNKFWGTAANWDLGRPPTLDDEVRLDVPAAAAPNGPIIQEGIAAQAKGILNEAAGEPTLTMTGGTLDVAEWIWWGDGMDSYAVWTMSGGTVNVANEFELGWGGGAGTLTMTGGTINAGEFVVPTGSGAFGELYLYGGTVNVTKAGGLEVNVNGLIDITDGTLILEGDETAKVNDLAAAGLITALGGQGLMQVDYDVRNPGKTTVTAAAAAPGLVAYYAMENDVLDGSHNGNDGTIMGDPNFVDGPAGFGMALAFDGDGDIVDCGYDPTLAIAGAVTLSGWINVGVPGLDHKVGGNQDGANGGYKMSVYNDKIEFEIRTATDSAVLNRSVEGGTVLEAGVWYHVAGVYSLEDGYIRTYVNGALDRELLTTEELGVSHGNFFIGCEPFNTGSYNFNGVMDEIRLYNIALSPHEVMGIAGQPVNPGADGLVANYEFENNVDDSSGNGLNGTIVGDPAFVDGAVGMALDFDGDGDYVDCNNSELFSITDAFTLSVWINWRTPTVSWQTVIAKGDNAWRLARGADTQTMDFGFTAGGDRGWQAARTASDVPLGEWHHVSATIDTVEGAKIYLDGVQDGSNPDTGGITVGDYPVFIGENPQAADRFWDGLIDEIAIYSRVLSVGEVMYLAGHRVPPVDPGTDDLLALWTCDEGEGAVVSDASGNGRDGVFVDGDPAWVEGASGSAVELIGPTVIETPPLDMELTQATMAGWILPYGAQPDWSSIIMQRDPGLATGFNILGYQLCYHWNDDSGSWSFRGGDMIAEDEWTFAAVTIEPDRASFYVNGEAGSVNEISHGPCMWDSNVYLGGDGTAGWVSRRMVGALDDVSIYGRALSAGEIRYLAGERATLVLFAEDFEGLALGPNVDEEVAGEAVWTDTPPEGWIIDESGIPGIGDPATDGVTEWAGWAFASKDWWIETAGDQDRSMFTLGVGTVAIADPDEWDDADRVETPIADDPYDTWLTSPAIDISGVAAGTLQLKFDSSWRPEFDSNYHQTASITASFDGGDPVEVMLWESDEASPNYKPYATNETVMVDLGNPEGATSVVLTFGLYDAGNDWWWAIDNIEVSGLAP